MSRSKNTYPGSQKMFSSSYRHFVVRQANVRALGAGKVADARQLQATEAHLADTVGAPDGGLVPSCDCCGPIDARGWQIDMTDGVRTFTCKACGERCHEEEGACWVLGTGEPHDSLACSEEAWVRFHAET